MNIIYLLFHGLSPYSGISKKILHQVKGFEACGHRVSLCTYSIADNGHRVRMINNEIIEDRLRRKEEFPTNAYTAML